MQIIRVEHEDGCGMFRDEFHGNIRDYHVENICESISDRHCSKFPIPCNDNLDLEKDDKEWFCAYKTIEQIQQWIKPEEFSVLFKHNYKVYLLYVTDYQIGNVQILYTKESIVTKTDISSLFKPGEV